MPTALGRLTVIPIINQFMHIYPNIDMIVHLSDGEVDMQKTNVDIAIKIGLLPSTTTLIVTKITSHSRVVVGSKRYSDESSSPCILKT